MATLWTIGHSSIRSEELVARLTAHRIDLVADVRRRPFSRRHPQFAKGALERALRAAGIGYSWMEALGGLRTPREGSPHGALAEPAFVGYADHMETAEFAAGTARLLDEAERVRVAVLCAEADPSHCHRSLLADWLVVHGHDVRHVRTVEDEPARHALAAAARVDVGGRLVYDGGQPALFGAR